MGRSQRSSIFWASAFTVLVALSIAVPERVSAKDPDQADVATLIDLMTFTGIVTQHSASVDGCTLRAEERSSIAAKYLEFNLGDLRLDQGGVVRSMSNQAELQLVVQRGSVFRFRYEHNGTTKYEEVRSVRWRYTESEYDLPELAEVLTRIVAACSQ